MDATASDVTTLSKLLKNGQIIDLRTPSTVSSEPDKVIPGTTRVSAPVTGTVNYTKFVTDSYSIKGFQKHSIPSPHQMAPTLSTVPWAGIVPDGLLQ